MNTVTHWSLNIEYKKEDGSWSLTTINKEDINNKYVESSIDEYLHEFEDDLNGILSQWNVIPVVKKWYGIIVMTLMKRMNGINY